MNEKLKALFTDSIGYLAVALASVVYVLSGLFVPGLTGKSVSTIVAEGAMGFILGMTMTSNMKLQGILKGKRSEEMVATKQAHAIAVQDIAGEIDGLELWCAERNEQKMREHRTHLLTAVGLHYADFFDEGGVALPYEGELSKEQKRTVTKARRAKLSQLSTAALTCDGEDADDPFNFGETPAQYQRRTNITDAFAKLLTAAIFGYFGVDMVENFDLASLVWRALFVAILLALGVAKQMSAYLFVTDTYRGNIVKKINHLQAYKNCARDYARRSKEENKDGNTEREVGASAEVERIGSVPIAGAEPVGKAAPTVADERGREYAKADEIPAAANEGVQHRHDGDRQDRRQQQLYASDGAGGHGLRREVDGAGQLRASGAGAIGRQGISAPVERGREGV